MRALGIDFSGDQAKWNRGCTVSNVWIAELHEAEGRLRLARLDRVQARYAGSKRPFEALAAELAAGDFGVAAIDAPFSVPARHVPRGGHASLLSLVATVPHAARDFPRAADFVAAVERASVPKLSAKPLRATEQRWVAAGVPTRSTLWSGARGGAAMTSACLTLLGRAGRPVWPWATEGRGRLAEAFPAAQLRTWALPHALYDASKGAIGVIHRSTIVAALGARADVGAFEPALLASADAIDAVLCAFAAVAVARAEVLYGPTNGDLAEGWIATHPT
jgi:hypothetical protein